MLGEILIVPSPNLWPGKVFKSGRGLSALVVKYRRDTDGLLGVHGEVGLEDLEVRGCLVGHPSQHHRSVHEHVRVGIKLDVSVHMRGEEPVNIVGVVFFLRNTSMIRAEILLSSLVEMAAASTP